MNFNYDKYLNENKELDIKKMERPAKLKYKFCKYAGLDPYIILVKKDITENWNNSFQRVMLEEGATEEELVYVLLGENE